jgi:hypothetical protein
MSSARGEGVIAWQFRSMLWSEVVSWRYFTLVGQSLQIMPSEICPEEKQPKRRRNKLES